jgi:methionine aminopeptidase
MKVRDLKTELEKNIDKAKVNKYMTSVSHWIKRIFESDKGRYVTRDFNEIDTLETLAGMDLISLRKGDGDNIIAELTDSGRELHQDFTGHGYYL